MLPTSAATTTTQPLPRVPRWHSLRNSLALAANPIPQLNRIHADYGPSATVYLGGMIKTILTRDPGLAQHVLQKNHRNYPKSKFSVGLSRYLGHGLLTSEGGYWLRQRRLIQPGFHRQRLAGLTELMRAVTQECLAPVAEAAAQQGGAVELNVHEWTTRVAFRIMTRSVFSGSVPEEELQRLSTLLTEIQAFYTGTIRQPYLRPWRYLRGHYRHHDRLAAELRGLIRGYVRRRTAPGAPPADDLLQMLLDARYEDTHAPMTEDQVLDEAIILLVAGHETSANALAWLWYLLARHPAEVGKLRAELAEQPEPITFDSLARLPYSRQVVQETLRLYPPAWIVDRVAREDDVYEGIELPAGTLVSVYLYGLHHAPALWDAPEEFRPGRFAADAPTAPVPYAYLPFGGGPRLCIGNQFALTELQLVLLETLRQFNVEWVEQPPVQLQPLVTLRPRDGIRLRFRLR